MNDDRFPEGSWASSPATRTVMQANRGRDTEPELAIRRALHRAGYRYRLQYPVPGAPRSRVDIAFPREKLAIEVRGCFWHGCPEHASWPKTNARWWREKITKNRQRDQDKETRLRDAGWTAMVVWEHDDVPSAVEEIVDELEGIRREAEEPSCR